ncbi:hypothetical protein, partial [Escherichia coli]|uniref:hypothetical protein n=1 Tax=Escherichia coli TaxID=562 RepID=UPI000A7D8AA6
RHTGCQRVSGVRRGVSETGVAFWGIKDSLTLGLNALTLTDVTKNAAYVRFEIESLVLEINAPASS